MKYHDSIEQAEQKMQTAIKQLQLWHIPATPINYAVSYDYINKASPKLNTAIDSHLNNYPQLDNFFLEEMYREHVLGQSSFRGELIDDLDDVMSGLQTSSDQSNTHSEQLMAKLDSNIESLKSANKREIFSAIKNIRQATHSFKLEQQQIAKQLAASKKSTDALRSELDEVRKEIYLDPLTGLYNRKAMLKHLDEWLTQDPDKQIAAIVISVDKFTKLNKKLGPLISNVLLSKVAKKVSNYVGDSGLPVRSGNDEFVILLPDISRKIAGEIAEKIRQGVERLQFVSAKSGTKLPQLTLSIGVSDYNVSTSANIIIQQTRKLLSNIQENLSNSVNIATN